jgi:hypothetical protein
VGRLRKAHHDRQPRETAILGKFSLLLTASLVSSLTMLGFQPRGDVVTGDWSLGATFIDAVKVISAYVLTYAALLLAAGSHLSLMAARNDGAGDLALPRRQQDVTG